jgi:uncharacterized membrane protein YgcG
MGAIGWIRFIITWAIVGGVFLAALLAFIDAARVPARFYEAKRPKRLWLPIIGAGLLFALMALAGIMQRASMLNIIAIIPSAIYWYAIRPEIMPAAAAARRAAGGRGGRASRGGRDSGVSVSTMANSSGRRNHNLSKSNTLDNRAAGNPNDPRFDA